MASGRRPFLPLFVPGQALELDSVRMNNVTRLLRSLTNVSARGLDVRLTPNGLHLTGDRRSRKVPDTAASPLVLVWADKDGGEPGDATTRCSFTYSIWLLGLDPSSDDPVATGLTPARARTRVGRYQTSAGYALAFVQGNGEWLLLDVYSEVPEVAACECP